MVAGLLVQRTGFFFLALPGLFVVVINVLGVSFPTKNLANSSVASSMRTCEFGSPWSWRVAGRTDTSELGKERNQTRFLVIWGDSGLVGLPLVFLSDGLLGRLDLRQGAGHLRSVSSPAP